MPPRDFKYRQLLLGKTEWGIAMIALGSLRSPCLVDCAMAFKANLNRTATFASMPPMISYMIRRDQVFYDNAVFKINGGVEIKLSDFLTKDLPEQVHMDVRRQMNEHKLLSENERNTIQAALGISDVEARLSYLSSMRESIDALFASIVLGSWTAFECLASDLWVIAVDKGPKEMAGRIAISNQLQKADENITTKTLQNLEYDVRTNFGSSLREMGRVSFQKLEDIRRFYAIAFGEDFKEKDYFNKTEDGYLYALASVRNLLVHRAGVVDKKFYEQAQRFDELKAFKTGNAILLDGAAVSKLRSAAMSVGVQLLQYVDRILTPAS